MVMRNIVKIDEEKCNGCGLCLNACAEGAIKLINGKARLISDIYCDGLGACLGHCPENAITIEKRDAKEFDEQATQTHLSREQIARKQADFVCPGMAMQDLTAKGAETTATESDMPGQLKQWPIQLMLVSPHAPYFKNADILLVADCVPFAMGDFHNKFLKDKRIVVGCPKLDDSKFYIEKFSYILKNNKLNSLTIIHMMIPCCSGLTYIAREAIKLSGLSMEFEDVTIDLHGEIIKSETVKV
ncbi:MAG: ATP-binding protein [Planctomycetota bacterium]|jgi:NAD-dependent dihydropyrimidine dehydrogenase PreA subunit